MPRSALLPPPIPPLLPVGPPPPLGVSCKGRLLPEPLPPPFYRGRTHPFSLYRLKGGALLVRWAAQGDFVISGRGRRVAIYPAAGVAALRLRDLLLTAVASFALLQRGIESLHASAVVCSESAVAFVGGPGTGKSTLAALFARSGYRLLCDDLLAVEARGGRLLAYPALPEIKLSAAAARALGLPLSRLPRLEPSHPKRLWRAPAARQPRSLSALYFPRLSASRTSRVRLTPLTPQAAFRALLSCSYNITRTTRKRLREQFRLFTRLAQRVPTRRLLVPRRWSSLREVRERIERDLASLRG